MHEDLITSAESEYAVETQKYFILYPNSNNTKMINLLKRLKAKKVPKGYAYNSGTNKNFLSTKDLIKIIHVIKKKDN